MSAYTRSVKAFSLAVVAYCVCLAPMAHASSDTYSLKQNRERVQKHFQDPIEEPTTKDAVWTTDDIFKVGVIDDGTIRNGYANYVCEVLYDYGFKGQEVWVQVIDIVQLVNTGKWKKLGEARCM